MSTIVTGAKVVVTGRDEAADDGTSQLGSSPDGAGGSRQVAHYEKENPS
jgi:hypothetical protein